MSDLEDLLGTTERLMDRRREKPKLKQIRTLTADDVRDCYTGVTVNWLMQAFQMSREDVRKRVAACAPLRYDGNNRPVYDFREAASYLVKPKIDIQTYIKQLKPKQLPNEMQTEYWSARLKQQNWEVKAGKLWRTEDVVDLFSEMFKNIKQTCQLFPDTIERESGLTEPQRKRIVELVDALQQEIYESVVELSKKRKTPSSVAYRDADTDEDAEDEDADA